MMHKPTSLLVKYRMKNVDNVQYYVKRYSFRSNIIKYTKGIVLNLSYTTDRTYALLSSIFTNVRRVSGTRRHAQ